MTEATPPEAVETAPLSVYEAEQQAELNRYRDEVEMPQGLHHGIWMMQRQAVCNFCDVGYLDLDAAVAHLTTHTAELATLQREQALAELEAADQAARKARPKTARKSDSEGGSSE